MIFALIYFAVNYGLGIVTPFVIGFVIALILKPLIDFLEARMRMKRRLAAVICVAFFYIVIGGLLTLLSVGIFGFIANLFRGLPQYYTEILRPFLLNITDGVNTGIELLDPEFKEILNTAFLTVLDSLGSAITSLSSVVVRWTSGVLTSVPGFFVNLLFMIVSTFFIASDYRTITSFIIRQLPERAGSLVLQSKRYLGEVIVQYLRSYSMILGITFIELLIALVILRVDNFVLIAFLIAMFDFLPVVGTGAVLIPWAIIVFIMGDFGMGAGLLAVYLFVTIVRNIIEPKIVGDSVGLHPLVTLVSMYVGTKLFGGIGLLGLPVSLAILNSLDEKGAIHIFKRDRAAVKPDGKTGATEENPEKEEKNQPKKNRKG
jgi:sporulation integral membrane protein YtvI